MNFITKLGLSIMGPELLTQNPELYAKYYKEAGLNTNSIPLATPVGSIQKSFNAQLAPPPSLPAPPINPENAGEQQAYNQKLLEYNQQFQVYHLKVMNTLFSNMQRLLVQSSINNRAVGNASPSPSTNTSTGSYSSDHSTSESILN